MTVTSGMMSSDCSTWRTPRGLLDLVLRVDKIALDPCGGPGSLVDAKLEVRPPEDGLAVDWAEAVQRAGGGLVFVNPPYGKTMGSWMLKCALEARRGVDVVALVPARTETAWWQESARWATWCCFFKGRIKFLRPGADAPDKGAPFPSAMLLFTRHPAVAARFVDAFGDRGHLVRF